MKCFAILIDRQIFFSLIVLRNENSSFDSRLKITLTNFNSQGKYSKFIQKKQASSFADKFHCKNLWIRWIQSDQILRVMMDQMSMQISRKQLARLIRMDRFLQ